MELNEQLKLEERVAELERHNKALAKRLEEAKHPKHGYGKHRFNKDIRVRWDFDHINEMLTVLVKLKHNKGIVLEIPESAFYVRDSPWAHFPRFAVAGAMREGEDGEA